MRAYLGPAAAVLALAAMTGAATAQTTSAARSPTVPSLVTVDLHNVLNDLAVRLKVDRANVPVTAQVPVNVAANVCGVSVNVLSASTGGQASCTAKTGSTQLAQAVQQQMSAGGAMASSQTGGASSTGMGSTTTAGQTASGGSTSGQMTTGQTTTGATAQQSQTPSTTSGAASSTQARSATTSGKTASTMATTEGSSSKAPGHVKKRRHHRSAKAYAPGQQSTPAQQNAPGQQPQQ